MQHPYIVNANANLRLNQLRSEAEHHRLIKIVSSQKTPRNFLRELKERLPILGSQRLDESASSPA